MAAPAPARHAAPVSRPNPLAWFLGILATIVGASVVSVILGCLIEWIGMNAWWANEGPRHAYRCLNEDLAHLADYRRSLLPVDGYEFALGAARWTGEAAAHLGLARLVRASAAARTEPAGETTAPAGPVSPGQIGRDVLQGVGPYAEAAYYVLQDTAVRLSVVLLALPAFALAIGVGLTDGLVRRDLRRWTGARESSAIYHYAKRWLWPASTLGFTLYLSWPTSGFNPAWAVLPGFVAMAALLSLMAASFKKYL